MNADERHLTPITEGGNPLSFVSDRHQLLKK
jgi:hypothetical protein